MRDDVRALYEVQKIEQEILGLKEQIRLYGPQLKEIETRHDRKKNELVEIEKREADLKKKHKELESSVKDKQEQIQKALGKQSQVKTNQEYIALTREIDTLQRDISSIEEQTIKLLSEEEKARAEIAKEKKEFFDEEEEIKEEKVRIERRIAERKERIKQIKEDKPRVLKNVDPELLAYYEKIGKRYVANVVVNVKNSSCTGCFSRLLPQEMVDLHRELEIIYCRNCRRIFAEDVDWKKDSQ